MIIAWRGGSAQASWLIGDTAYGTGEIVAWMIAENPRAHLPLWNRASAMTGPQSLDVVFDADLNPLLSGRHALATIAAQLPSMNGRCTKPTPVLYRGKQGRCGPCALKQMLSWPTHAQKV